MSPVVGLGLVSAIVKQQHILYWKFCNTIRRTFAIGATLRERCCMQDRVYLVIVVCKEIAKETPTRLLSIVLCSVLVLLPVLSSNPQVDIPLLSNLLSKQSTVAPLRPKPNSTESSANTV